MTTRKLGRKKEHRERTLRNLATSLVLFEKVQTTEAKAKAVISLVERLISRARKDDLAARRYSKSLLFDMNATSKLFEDIIKRLGTRTSGFVRITKLNPRAGDGAAMAQIELLLTSVEELIGSQTKTKVSVQKASATPTEDKQTLS